jgi:uncharacterized protein
VKGTARRMGRVNYGGLIVLLIFVAAFVLMVRGQRSEGGPDALLKELEAAKRPGCVFDFAGVMRSSDVEAVELILRQFEAQTGGEIKLVTVKSLRGGDIEDFANKLFARWGIGKKGQDNGVLLLAAIEDKRVRIEVGYGFEAILTDARAGRILDEQVLPYFRAGDYSGGLRAGAVAIVRQLSGEPEVAVTPPPAGSSEQVSPLAGLLYFMGFVALIILIARHPWLALFMMGGRGGGGFQGGGFGGGFGGGGFGGGMSGGGGASRGW